MASSMDLPENLLTCSGAGLASMRLQNETQNWKRPDGGFRLNITAGWKADFLTQLQ